jgi:hypothetical protein
MLVACDDRPRAASVASNIDSKRVGAIDASASAIDRTTPTLRRREVDVGDISTEGGATERYYTIGNDLRWVDTLGRVHVRGKVATRVRGAEMQSGF